MLDKSRMKLYNYLYDLFHGTVTENVYVINQPQDLTESDTTDGFIVIRIGDVNDESEFSGEAYGWARCYVDAYIPPVSRGRVDADKYSEFEDGINMAVELASQEREGTYNVQEGSLLSLDVEETSNADNIYFVFVKSFVVNINK